MEFQDVVRRRHMVRDFDDRPLPPAVVEAVVGAALRGPSAGFTQGFDLLVLEGPEQTGPFWEAEVDPEHRRRMTWPGLVRAPLVLVPLMHEQAYRDRYGEPDKRRPGRPDPSCRVPWWVVDTAFASMLALLAATDAGLGALFFAVRQPDRVRAAFAVPAAFDPIGAIAVGHPRPDRPSSSLARGRRPAAAVVHRGRW